MYVVSLKTEWRELNLHSSRGVNLERNKISKERTNKRKRSKVKYLETYEDKREKLEEALERLVVE